MIDKVRGIKIGDQVNWDEESPPIKEFKQKYGDGPFRVLGICWLSICDCHASCDVSTIEPEIPGNYDELMNKLEHHQDCSFNNNDHRILIIYLQTRKGEKWFTTTFFKEVGT